MPKSWTQKQFRAIPLDQVIKQSRNQLTPVDGRYSANHLHLNFFLYYITL